MLNACAVRKKWLEVAEMHLHRGMAGYRSVDEKAGEVSGGN
jgi:hypothetical protein